MPAFSSRKSSQLMAAMLEVCPRGSKKCILFPCLFLRRLPQQLHMLLARPDLSDLKGLAEQVEELWTHHAFEDLVAAVQQLFTEEEPIAAVRPGVSVAQGTKGFPWKKKGGKKPPPKESTQWRKARQAAGICLPHWIYGAAAEMCHPPCSGWETEEPGASQHSRSLLSSSH
jgi:hypothetical protein